MNHKAQEHTSFTFEGRKIHARKGQSLAGALHGAGVRTLTRGVKYHTPRGYTCGFGACGDCPLTVNGMPNSVSCTTPVQGGEIVKRQGSFPHARFDIFRTADFMRPWLGAGFQFKLFSKRPFLSRLAGAGLAVLAGGGRYPSRSAASASVVKRVDTLTADVAVIGGGLSGLTAALEAASTGRHVVIVDRDFHGGRSAVRTEQVTDGKAPIDIPKAFDEAYQRVASNRMITMIEGVAIGIIDGLIPVLSGDVRLEITTPATIIAAGSYEVPVLIENHDRPGVMFADAALKLAIQERVLPGRKAVVIRADQRADAVAKALGDTGVEVVAVIDAADVQRITGFSKATGVRLRTPGQRNKKVRADLVCVAGARRPADELALHAEYNVVGSHDRVTVDDFSATQGTVRVGSNAGNAYFDLDEVRTATRTLLLDVNPPIHNEVK